MNDITQISGKKSKPIIFNIVRISFLACVINISLFAGISYAAVVDEAREASIYNAPKNKRNTINRQPNKRVVSSNTTGNKRTSTSASKNIVKTKSSASASKAKSLPVTSRATTTASTNNSANIGSSIRAIKKDINTNKQTIDTIAVNKNNIVNENNIVVSENIAVAENAVNTNRMASTATKVPSANKPPVNVRPVNVLPANINSVNLPINDIVPATRTALIVDKIDSNIDDEYFFDSSLLLGGNSAGLAKFNNANSYMAGTYYVDVYVNNKFKDRMDIEFRSLTNDSDSIEPCLSKQFFDQIDVAKFNSEVPECIPISQRVAGAAAKYNSSTLRLDISIPQAMMNNRPRGYVDPKDWQGGESVAFVNYNMSHNYSSQRDYSSSYLGLSSGINLGLWRVRQQSSYTYSENDGSHWRSIRAYVQRAIPAIHGEVTVGDTFTDGRFLSGMSYRGIQLASDERMYPDTQRGYAPVIRGTATGNATVIVRQRNMIIYQTTVSSGPFEITDILPVTRYDGDLEVEVIEPNGQKSSFVVPFSAIPDSLREGRHRYSSAAGYLRNTNDSDKAWFGEITYQYGLNNNFTLNTASRIGENYYAFVLGMINTSWIGAFGANATYSHTKLPVDKTKDGWMANLSYSRTLQATGTTITFAGYRYSTEGYRDYSDVIGVRNAYRLSGAGWTSSTYLQKTRLELSMNQSLSKFGSLYMSASRQYYRDARQPDTQIQAGYAGNLMSLSYTLNVARTYNHSKDKNENNVSLTVSMPLGTLHKSPFLQVGTTRSPEKEYSTQASITGIVDDESTLNYGINVNHDSITEDVRWGVSVNKSFPVISVNAHYNNNGGSDWSGGFALRGAAAAHSDGVTFGSYVGDTFALVEAKNAAGAKLGNGNRVEIDRFGYALVPSLSPYRYNTIRLDSEGMDSHVELKDNQKQIAPYAGAVVKVKFDTITGFPVLIRGTFSDNNTLPLGADVLNKNKVIIGMVGQGGQIYARVSEEKGTLYVQWGEESSDVCTLDYSIANQGKQDIYRANAICK